MVPRSRDGVLLVGYGTVTDLHDLPEFLTRVRGGRPPTEALIADARRRYRAIGGSPLLENTRAQAAALVERLGIPASVAMRAWHPTLEEALEQVRAAGLDRLCVLPLAPFNTAGYLDAVTRATERVGQGPPPLPDLVPVSDWGSEPGLARAHAAQIRAHADALDAPDTALLLTAHSLPLRLGSAVARYQERIDLCADAIQRELGRGATVCFQSQSGPAPEWLGPDLRSALRRARAAGASRIVVAPIGFLAEHLETLYDLDIECANWASEAGLAMSRVPALGTATALIELMADLVRRALT